MSKRTARHLAAATMLSAFAAASIGSLAYGAQSGSGEEYSSYTGEADAQQDHRFLYGETHLLMRRGGRLVQRLVLYTCRDGSPFARKTSAYDEPWAPDFLLEDASNGMREGVRGQTGTRQVFFRANHSDHERIRYLRQAPKLVIDTGFDAFVRDNWQALMRDDGVTLKFLVPSHLSDMGFRIQHVRGDQVDGVPADVFRVSLNGVFGLLVPDIDVYYRRQDHVLLRYVGLVDLLDASGNNLRADISYSLSNPRLADELDWTRALGAHLQPCR